MTNKFENKIVKEKWDKITRFIESNSIILLRILQICVLIKAGYVGVICFFVIPCQLAFNITWSFTKYLNEM